MKEDIRIDIFRPSYARGILECFRAVYGEAYPVKTFYDAYALEHAFKTGSLYPVVAIKDEKIIGVMGMYRSSAVYEGLYETGAGIVLPEYRGLGVSDRLYGYICEELTRQTGIEEMFGESVCNHIKIQKAVLHYDNVETGIEVDLMPEEAFHTEKSSSGRVSVDLHFLCLKDKPHDIYVPELYKDCLAFLYGDPKRRRNFVASTEKIPSNTKTEGSYSYFDGAGVARLMLLSTGSDLASYMDDYERDITSKGASVSQVFFRLDSPWVGETVEILKEKGYFLGGVTPRWFDKDGMFMQKVYVEPNWDGIQLYSERAKRILEMIKQDYRDL